MTNGQTDRQTDESDFVRRCPTNAERPKSKIFSYENLNNSAIQAQVNYHFSADLLAVYFHACTY